MTQDDPSPDHTALEDICAIVFEAAAIVATPAKNDELIVTIRQRMDQVAMCDPKDYRQFFEEHYEAECGLLAAAISPHYTAFFRDSAHFQHIDRLLPMLIAKKIMADERKISIWCIGCSYGHEAYSIAMYLDHKIKQLVPTVDFCIFATDIDPRCIEYGKAGVYAKSDLVKVPASYLANHWTKGTGELTGSAIAGDSIKNKIEWHIMDIKSPGISFNDRMFDLIFCRNVLYRFDGQDIDRCLKLIARHLLQGGRLFTGLAEPSVLFNAHFKNQGDNTFEHSISSNGSARQTNDGFRKIRKKTASG